MVEAGKVVPARRQRPTLRILDDVAAVLLALLALAFAHAHVKLLIRPVFGSQVETLDVSSWSIDVAIGVLATAALPNGASQSLPLIAATLCIVPRFVLIPLLADYFGPATAPTIIEVVSLAPLGLVSGMICGKHGRAIVPNTLLLVSLLPVVAFASQTYLLRLVNTHGLSLSSDLRLLVLLVMMTLTLPFSSKVTALCAFALVAVAILLQSSASHRLHSHGFKLIDRQDSLTGYISVLESIEDQYRVLRCDSALLGGEWLPTPERAHVDGITVAESVFPVFTMLEAVRLVSFTDVEDRARSHEGSGTSKALVVGLGVGTCPAALSSHGIDTTVVELDPTVSAFAKLHFGLPSNVTVVNSDALLYIPSVAAEQYDFVIHDVFTGGAEPLDLFTLEFLFELRRILRPAGVVAVNYAGNLKDSISMLAIRTITHVFGECRAYRDAAPVEGSETDFVNLVIFCSKEHMQPWRFRDAREADFLGSVTRRNNIPPKHLISLKPYMMMPGSGPSGAKDLLVEEDLTRWKDEQSKSAARHWRLMRNSTIPRGVWNLY